MSARDDAELIAERIAKEVEGAAGMGLNAVRIFLTARVKETLSVPAPRKRVIGRDGVPRYVATEPATKGAPPRKLSGRLRGGMTSEMVSPTEAVIGTNVRAEPTPKYPRGFGYPEYHETVKLPPFKKSGQHQFITPTFDKYEQDLVAIVGAEIQKA